MNKRELNALLKNDQAIADLKAVGGIVAKGAWQVGTGNYKKARGIPVGAQICLRESRDLPAAVAFWFTNHPRAQACVAIV